MSKDTTNAERQRRHRAKKRDRNGTVTPAIATNVGTGAEGDHRPYTREDGARMTFLGNWGLGDRWIADITPLAR